ncbi:hypothetical protein CAPTEDRAFT_200403 [Capitella teleta]|uniref:RING-type domain-containing protein n=1 Tax=Capitella teleta TaxID=283909 RepID=R7T5P3_CAPTE|nr:hypothetical protein CAPTEDRAFT_200403 [Capitella teleta]|eukprot:ELT88488.1 hypothetical protein CAPTEDRAFT_200403 [Capitella teleta]
MSFKSSVILRMLQAIKRRNADIEEEFTDDNEVMKNQCSVILKRFPLIDKENINPSRPRREAVDPNVRLSVEQLKNAGDLAVANASEEDKVAAMMHQSTEAFGPANWERAPPFGYICNICGKGGHWNYRCWHKPKGNDKVRRGAGIPRSQLELAKDPAESGALLMDDGTFMVPKLAKSVQDWQEGVAALSPPAPEDGSKELPEEFKCPICREMLKEAAIIRCCGYSFCDDCIRDALLDSEHHTCPQCGAAGQSPDALVANKTLRKMVDNHENGTGWRSVVAKISASLDKAQPPAIKRQRLHGNVAYKKM